MNIEAKQKLLEAFDALIAVSTARKPGPHHSPHGNSAGCAYCGEFLSDGQHEHPDDGSAPKCPVAQAILALEALVPNWMEREAWLADPNRPPPQPWEKASP